MRIAPGRASLRTLFLTLTIVTSVLAPMTVFAQGDAARFTDLIAARDEMESVATPQNGDLLQNQETIATASSESASSDFSATATFENPADSGTVPWDFGFVFHQDESSSQQIFVNSDGTWYYASYPSGILESGSVSYVDTAPGATNTIDLIFAGNTAVLGPGGKLVTSLIVPPSLPSTVQVGTGFLRSTTVPGRSMVYHDFQVWLPQAANSAASSEQAKVAVVQSDTSSSNDLGVAVTPESDASGTIAPEASPASVEGAPDLAPSTDAEAFALLLGLQAGVAPIAGPFAANLKEEQGRASLSWAGVNEADFHARATFDVPATSSATRWDAGFSFRSTPAGPLRVSIDSLGNWYYSINTGGPSQRGLVTNLVTATGGTNTIDLFVAKQGAVFGVNGAFIAAIDLPADSAAGDVAASSSFFSDQLLPDRIVAFRDFTVSPFDPDALSAETPEQQVSNTDAGAFATYLADTQTVAPAAGPFAGRLVESSPEAVPQAAAGIALANFAVKVAFTNPSDIAAAPWDAGFQFRSDGDSSQRIVVRSSGEIFSVLPDGTPLLVETSPLYNPAPGAVNEFQLFVRDNRALFGVNGQFALSIELSADPIASDVVAGAAYFDGDYVQGRVTDYAGFSVWEMA